MIPGEDPPGRISERVRRWLRAAGDDPAEHDDGSLADLCVAVEACLAAGREVAGWYRRHATESIGHRDKSGGDPVTPADRAADRSLHERLAARRPRDAVLSEESDPPPSERSGGRLWVCDPLDGTREFLARNGEFCVMVGLAVRGEARLGALHRPDPGTLYLGFTDGGAWRVDLPADADSGATSGREEVDDHPPSVRRLEAPRREERSDVPVRLVHSRSHRPDALEGLVRGLGTVEAVPHGSSGLKCALVAEGRADLYVHPVPYLREWDTCAPEAVLRGAGGLVTDCDGEPLSYGSDDPRQPRGILAGGPGFHLQGLRALRQIGGS